MTSTPNLEDIRREIDEVDSALHDLIMRRADIVMRVGAFKQANALTLMRPAREAEILRRLTSRHKGPIPKAIIVRIWREIISAMLSIEGTQAVAVYQPAQGAGYLELARDHYGTGTPTIPVISAAQVVSEVAGGHATVGILPLPDGDAFEPWWIGLMGERANSPRVIARLPFAGRGDGIEALAIACQAPEPTGYDRSWIGLESNADVSRTRLRSVLGAAGLEQASILASQNRDEMWLHLVEIFGHIAPGDRRLQLLMSQGGSVGRAVVLGGYAVPLSPEDLGEHG